MTEIIITLRRRKTENLCSAGNMQLNIASEINRSGRIDSRLQRNPAAARLRRFVDRLLNGGSALFRNKIIHDSALLLILISDNISRDL